MESDQGPKVRPQHFSGRVETKQWGPEAQEDPDDLLIATLSTPDDSIFIPANQEPNSRLVTIDKTSVLAEIDLLGGDQRILLGRVDDPNADFINDTRNHPHGTPLHPQEGDYFIAIGNQSGGLTALGILPKDNDRKIVGPTTDLRAERYGVVSTFHDPSIHLPPIQSGHELVFETSEDGISIKLYPKTDKDAILPVQVKTRIFPEHHTALEEFKTRADENSAELGIKPQDSQGRGKMLGQSLLRFLRRR